MPHSLPTAAIDLDTLAQQYRAEGFVIARGLFTTAEVDEIKGRFMQFHREGIPGVYEPGKPGEGGSDPNDPLNQYPRFIHPHLHDEMSFRYLIDPRVGSILEALLEGPPLAVQTMFYYKPPGARGQALHQDQIYLLVEPGTCMAAWTAVDDCDAENGAMVVVPNTNHEPCVCPEDTGDINLSFTRHYVPVPAGKKAVLQEMKAGDTLFFNGSVIHGSGPNRSKTRFRRSFIAHYATSNAQKISAIYQPAFHMDGRKANLGLNAGGGPCGAAWVGARH